MYQTLNYTLAHIIVFNLTITAQWKSHVAHEETEAEQDCELIQGQAARKMQRQAGLHDNHLLCFRYAVSRFGKASKLTLFLTYLSTSSGEEGGQQQGLEPTTPHVDWGAQTCG